MLPVVAVIERHIKPMFGPRVQKARPDDVFPDHMNVIVFPDAGDYFFPGFAIVIRLPDIGGAIVHLVTYSGHIRHPWFEMRRLDGADAGILHHIRWGNILPGSSIVSRHMNKAIVGTGPQGVDVLPGGRKGKYSPIDLRPIHIAGDDTA